MNASEAAAELEAIDWRRPFRRARHAVRSHWPLLVGSALVALLLLVLFERIFPPVYVATVTVQAEPNEDAIRGAYYANWNVFRKGDVRSEPELVTSGRVIEAVMRDLNLRFDDVHHGFWTHVAYLWSESWLGRNYRDFKAWLFPPPADAHRPTPEEIDLGRTAKALADSISVENVFGTTFASIVVRAPSGRVAQIANKVADSYLAERNRMFRAEAQSAFDALQVEASRAAAELAAVDRRRVEFDTDNQIVLDFEKDKLVISNWATLTASIIDLESAIASLEAQRTTIQRQLAAEPAEVTSSKTLADGRVKGMLQTREFELNASLLQLRDRYRPDAPEVTQIERLLAETREALRKEPDNVAVGQDRTINPVHNDLRQRLNLVHAQLASARASIEQKRGPLAEIERRIYSVPGLVKQITELNREREGLELRYKLLRERAMMADVSRTVVSSTAPSVRIIDYARPSDRPVFPRNIVLVPAALGLGLFVGLALALALELLSTRVNRDRLAGRRDMPVYALVALPGGPGPAARLRLPG